MNEETIYHQLAVDNGKILLFSEYEHFSPYANYVVGKPIYIHSTQCKIDKEAHISKRLFGEDYINLAYVIKDGKHLICRDIDMAMSACANFPSLLLGTGIFNGQVFAQKNSRVNIFEPRKQLDLLVKTHRDLGRIRDKLIKRLQIQEDCIGITGSASLGAVDYNDYDFVFYGNKFQLNELRNRILFEIAHNRVVYEHDFFWPCRFYYDDKLICCFFNYIGEDYISFLKKIRDADLSLSVPFTAEVDDDSFSLSKTPYFSVKSNQVEDVVLMSNGFKGVFRKGDIIQGKCHIYTAKDGRKTAICIDPFKDLSNYKNYFNPLR